MLPSTRGVPSAHRFGQIDDFGLEVLSEHPRASECFDYLSDFGVRWRDQTTSSEKWSPQPLVQLIGALDASEVQRMERILNETAGPEVNWFRDKGTDLLFASMKQRTDTVFLRAHDSNLLIRSRNDSELPTVSAVWRLDSPEFALQMHRNLIAVLAGRLEDSGSVLFHASASAFDAGAVAFIGPGGSGKSTFNLLLARACGGRFMANDRLAMRTNGRDVSVRAIPLALRLTRRTVEQFPGALDLVLSGKTRRAQPLGHDIEQYPTAASTRLKFELTPAEFCSSVGMKLQHTGQLRAVVLPEVGRGHAGEYVRRLEPGELRSRIESSCFTPFDPDRPNQWLHTHHSSQSSRLWSRENLLSTLESEVPAFSLRASIDEPASFEAAVRQLDAELSLR